MDATASIRSTGGIPQSQESLRTPRQITPGGPQTASPAISAEEFAAHCLGGAEPQTIEFVDRHGGQRRVEAWLAGDVEAALGFADEDFKRAQEALPEDERMMSLVEQLTRSEVLENQHVVTIDEKTFITAMGLNRVVMSSTIRYPNVDIRRHFAEQKNLKLIRAGLGRLA